MTISRLNSDIPSFRLYGRDLPNPYLFAKRQFPNIKKIVLTPVIGLIHGDLHGDNLLIGEMEGTKNDFYIIDLALFKEGLPLFFDHAYLEFSLLLHARGTISCERYIELVEDLVNIESNKDIPKSLKAQGDHGLFWSIAQSRHSIGAWINDYQKNRKQDMTNQLLLSRSLSDNKFVTRFFLRRPVKEVGGTARKTSFGIMYSKKMFELIAIQHKQAIF